MRKWPMSVARLGHQQIICVCDTVRRLELYGELWCGSAWGRMALACKVGEAQGIARAVMLWC